MSKYGMSFDEYLSETIMESIKALQEPDKEKPVGFFPLEILQNIPLIEYPGFSKEQNIFAMEMAKQVLLVSRNENNYQEVAITYDPNNPKEYITVKGDSQVHQRRKAGSPDFYKSWEECPILRRISFSMYCSSPKCMV